MKNPCDVCLVSPMCKEGCEDLINDFVRLVTDLKPGYEPVFHPYFRPYIASVIKKHNKHYKFSFIMVYADKSRDPDFTIDVPCNLIIDDRKLIDVEMVPDD